MVRQRKNRTAKKKQIGQFVQQDFAFANGITTNSGVLGVSLVNLSPAAPAAANELADYCEEIADYCDMYRFARLDWIELQATISQSSIAAGGSVAFNGFVLSHLLPGATAPSNLLQVENPSMVVAEPHTVTISDSAGTTFTPVARGVAMPTLRITGDQLEPTLIAGGPGKQSWIATEDDSELGASTPSWGQIYIVSRSPANNTNDVRIDFHVRLRMSFYQLVDPATISARRRNEAGYINRQRRKPTLRAPLVAPEPSPAPTPDVDAELLRLQMRIYQLRLQKKDSTVGSLGQTTE